jgi:Flp pilus assembly secretin CpaC
MKKANSRSIIRVRTFDDDISRARGMEVPEAPKVKRTESTAQEITDTVLKGDIRDATEYQRNNRLISLEKRVVPLA